MWTSSKIKQAVINARPIRVAYLVPDPPSHELLDHIFNESLSRWGGRRTPIVPTNGSQLTDTYWRFLSLWDTDILYSYIELAPDFHRRLAHRLAPSEIHVHQRANDDLRPDIEADPLRATSIVPMLGKWRSYRGQALLELLDKERHVEAPRDMADTFGFPSSCLNDFALLPYARRLSLKPPGNNQFALRFQSPEEITYLESAEALETKIASDRSLLCLAVLSDMFAPYLPALHDNRGGWDDHLSLIVGDEVSDRLLFWNAIHRYQSLSDSSHLQLIRMSHARFSDGVPDWIVTLCSGVRNRRHLNGNAAPRTVVRSCSTDQQTLERIAGEINRRGMNMASVSRHADFSPLEATANDRARNRRNRRGPIFIPSWQSVAPKTDSHVRFDNDQFELPLVPPFHLRELSLGPMTGGSWAVDLRIERNEDHSPFDNQIQRWMFPRRLRLESSIDIQNYGPGRFARNPFLRPTNDGDLSLSDALEWRRPLLSLPSDIRAFTLAVMRHHPEVPQAPEPEGLEHAYRLSPVRISDKGRDLLGVFQLFRSLTEALLFLTNPYWLSVIDKLCPTEPDDNPDRVQELAREFQRTIAQHGNNLDCLRLAKRAMSRTANWMHADQKQNASLHFDALSALVSPELRRSGRRWQNDLEESVKYLRDRDFLRQGYSWQCETCQYMNWSHLGEIVPMLHCEICRTEASAPVCGNKSFHFRLNPFVAAAFSSTSAQGSVAWALNRLTSRACWSLMFTPAVDVWKIGQRDRFTDIDLLASVDGEIYLLEVKRGFAGIDDREIAKLSELAAIIRPDYAGFAVTRPRSECTMDQATQARITRAFSELDVEFLLWTADDADQPHILFDIPSAFGRTMNWSAW